MSHPNCSACNDPGTEGFDWFDRTMFEIHLAIASVGWKGMYVYGRTRPNWGYTIGLVEQRHHPELVLVGLRHEVASLVVGRLARAVLAGERFGATGVDAYELDGVPLRFAHVHHRHWETDRFAMWTNYYGALGPYERQIPWGLQVLWPDARHRFPGDCDVDPRVKRRQPRLARAPRRPPIRPAVP